MVGDLTDEEKEAFTRVLQGHIALEKAVFPAGARGLNLDITAREPLWKNGLDFNHGTGHGVGHVLSVTRRSKRLPLADCSGTQGFLRS